MSIGIHFLSAFHSSRVIAYTYDILFFSSFCIDSVGNITDPTAAETYAREIMLKNSAEKIFLCDSEKFNRRSTYTLTSADDIDACVFDAEYSALKCKCRIIV